MTNSIVPVSQLVRVTPEVAASLLKETAVYQRKAAANRIEKYADIMRRGHWKETQTQQIAISTDGKVIDGRHRLKAVISANTSVDMWICYNSPEDIFSALDQGYNRTKSQLATMASCKHSKVYHVAAVNALQWHPQRISSICSVYDSEDIIFLLNYYEPQISSIFPQGYNGHSNLQQSAFRGAMLRALISLPNRQDEIVNFLKVAAEGIPLPDANIDITMPLLLRSILSKTATSSFPSKMSAFCAAQRALKHFLNGTTIKHKENLKVRDKDYPKSNYFSISLDTKPVDVSAHFWLEYNA